jgi:hypothetical protein
MDHRRGPSDLDVELAIVSGLAASDLFEETTSGVGFNGDRDLALVIWRTSAEPARDE